MVISRVVESTLPMLPNEFNFSAKWVHNLFEIFPIHVPRESWKVDGPSNQFPSQCNSIRASVLNPPSSHADNSIAEEQLLPLKFHNII